MREYDIDQTRSINTNSAVNLSRKPRPDLSRDLLQHLQGVLRDCTETFQIFSFYIVIVR